MADNYFIRTHKNRAEIMKNKRVFINNPVIFKGLGLAPLIVAGRTVENALVMSLAVLILLVATRLMTAGINHFYNFKHRIVIYAVCAAISYVFMFFLLNRVFGIAQLLSLQLYLPLLVVDPIIIKRAERHSKEPVKQALYKSLTTAVGFAVSIFFIGGIREFLGYGTLAGEIIMETPIFPIARLVSGGFIITGVVAALWKCIIVMYWRLVEMGAKSSQ